MWILIETFRLLQWVLSVDLFANEDADANVVISETQSWTTQGEEVRRDDLWCALSTCGVVWCGVCVRWWGSCTLLWVRTSWTPWCVWPAGGLEEMLPRKVPSSLLC